MSSRYIKIEARFFSTVIPSEPWGFFYIDRFAVVSVGSGGIYPRITISSGWVLEVCHMTPAELVAKLEAGEDYGVLADCLEEQGCPDEWVRKVREFCQ